MEKLISLGVAFLLAFGTLVIIDQFLQRSLARACEREDRGRYERFLHNQPLTIEEIQQELAAWDRAS